MHAMHEASEKSSTQGN